MCLFVKVFTASLLVDFLNLKKFFVYKKNLKIIVKLYQYKRISRCCRRRELFAYTENKIRPSLIQSLFSSFFKEFKKLWSPYLRSLKISGVKISKKVIVTKKKPTTYTNNLEIRVLKSLKSLLLVKFDINYS